MARKTSHSSKTHPTLERAPGKKDNWIEAAGGLPELIEAIAKHIHYDSGLSISHSIAAAVERVKVLAAKGNARAIKSLAAWNAKKAGSAGKSKKLSNDSTNIVSIAYELARVSRSSSTGIKSANAGTGRVSGSGTGGFDENKHVRSPLDGKFAEKFTSSQLLAARRVVEGAISNLGVGQSVDLPNRMGYVKRTEAGYVVQGPAGFYVATRIMSEAIQAAASIIAGKMKVGRTK